MKSSSVLIYAGLLLFVGIGHAAGTEAARFSVQDASLTNGAKTLKRTLFIGHYGETFTYGERWFLHTPQLKDGIEIVRFSRLSALATEPDPGVESAFEHPEEYGPKQLEQLLVIPKENRSYEDLATLRAAKEKDLTEKGFLFEISGAPMPIADWPTGTFEVRVTSPYRLTQVYTEAKEHLYIITGSGHTGSEDPFVEELGRMYFHSLTVRHADERDAMATGGFLYRSIPLVACGLLLLSIPWKKGAFQAIALAALGAGLLSLVLGFSAFHLAETLTEAGRGNLVSPGPIGWSLFGALLAITSLRVWRLEGIRQWIALVATIAATLLTFCLIMGLTAEIQTKLYTVAQEFQTLNWAMGLAYGFCLGLTITRTDEPR